MLDFMVLIQAPKAKGFQSREQAVLVPHRFGLSVIILSFSHLLSLVINQWTGL